MAVGTREQKPRRTHIRSKLMRESLLDKGVIASTESDEELQILPDVNVIALGGQSILDRGKEALFPLLDEIVHCRKKHKIIVGVGGGARVRHTYHICLDLGIPLGGLAMVAGAVDEQNTRLLQSLLAKHKGITLNKDHFLDLPLWLEAGMIPIMTGMPPYHYWEPPTGGRVPTHGEDLGMFMVSEVLGARSMIYLKDEDGLYTADPKKDPKAKFIPSIEAGELLRRDLPDLIIERTVVETLLRARHTRRIQIINGLKPRLLRAALNGDESVGTVIYAGGDKRTTASGNGNGKPRRK
jgi:molybdenum storage protein